MAKYKEKLKAGMYDALRPKTQTETLDAILAMLVLIK